MKCFLELKVLFKSGFYMDTFFRVVSQIDSKEHALKLCIVQRGFIVIAPTDISGLERQVVARHLQSLHTMT